MKKAATAAKGATSAPSKKAFNAGDYSNALLSKDEVIEIKQAFDIFDGDGSGVIDPQELKRAFIEMGFAEGGGKFIYQILAELDEDGSGGIEFEEFVRLAAAKTTEKDSRQDINKVFGAFDKSRQVNMELALEKVQR